MAATRHMVSLVLSNRFVYASCLPYGVDSAPVEPVKHLFQSSSKDLPADMFKPKLNKADKEACAIVAADFAKRLKEHGISHVQVQGKYKYHGRVRTFIDTLREAGVKC